MYDIIISKFERSELFLVIHFEEMGIFGDRSCSTLC